MALKRIACLLLILMLIASFAPLTPRAARAEESAPEPIIEAGMIDAAEEVDLGGFKELFDAGAQGLRDAVFVGVHLVDVDADVGRVHAEGSPLFGKMTDFGGVQQGLGRDAAAV